MEALSHTLAQLLADQKASLMRQEATFAALAADVAASRADVAASRAEVRELRTEVASLRAQMADDAVESVATPRAYEDSARSFLLSELERRFGLRAIAGASPHRLEGEIGLAGDSAEWDFRLPVTVFAPPTHPTKSLDFVIFPDKERYVCPPRPTEARRLTPTRTPGAVAPPVCDYMVVFEITTSDRWPRGLLPRLEQRLRVTLDRARAQPGQGGIEDVLSVCAVIGVVSPFACEESVGARVSETSFPLLFRMMSEARFVWLGKSHTCEQSLS